MPAETILIYGDTGDGKTPLIGELAQAVFKSSGGRINDQGRAEGGLITRLYAGDEGGWKTIEHLVDLGIIEVVDVRGMPRPWEWLRAITTGAIRHSIEPRWVRPEPPNTIGIPHELVARVGVYAFEGMKAYADALMADLRTKAAANVNIGGQGAIRFTDGETTVGSNNQAHYGIVQGEMASAVRASFSLPTKYVVWTTRARRAADSDTTTTILGPEIIGKAMTSDVPAWFVYTFRVMSIPEDAIRRTPAEHRLYWADHIDPTTPGAKGLANCRLPLGTTLPEGRTYLAPASLVGALDILQRARQEARARVVAEIQRQP